MEQRNFAHPAWIEVDLQVFQENLRLLKNYVSPSKVCLAVKANAYGHGLIPIAKAAQTAGVDYLGVAHSSEGAALREAGIGIPILVLGAIHEEQLADLLHYELEFSIASHFKARLVAKKCAELKQHCRVHLEIDTGMHRTGVRDGTAMELFAFLQKDPWVDVAGVYSHFASSDDLAQQETTEEQLDLFLRTVQKIQRAPGADSLNILRHIANSGAICNFPRSHLDMVRCGILAFGEFHLAPSHPLSAMKPFLSLKAKIAFFKVVEAGKGISYGHTFKTSKATRVVTIPVGYGDGFRRALSNKGHILIRGKSYPIVGNICMDQFMVDIGEGEGQVGEEVVLIGEQNGERISLGEVARLCDTIPYEILCGFNDRLPRVYLGF